MKVGDRVWHVWHLFDNPTKGEIVTVKRINRKTVTIENEWLQLLRVRPEHLRPLAEVAAEQGWNWTPNERGY